MVQLIYYFLGAKLFILQFNDFSNISDVGDSTDPSYNPVFFLLDSTEVEPSPSEAAEVLASLPSGYVCEDVVVTSAGSSSNYWEFSLTNPQLETPVWSSEITFEILDGQRTSFWVRANTIFEEIPKDDRDASLNVYGEIKEV